MTGTNFLNKFKPENQALCTENLERCYMGTAPALAAVGKAFGNQVAEFWLSAQLIDLSEFAGSKVKLTAAQADAAAKVIKAEFGYMKVTELMHFFLLFKGGRYGKFYGAVDPITITEALHQFAKDRYDTIRKYEKEHQRREEEQQRSEHEAEVMRFRQALAVCNMPVYEWALLNARHSLTLEETAEIGWLFRLGYETSGATFEMNKQKALQDFLKAVTA